MYLNKDLNAWKDSKVSDCKDHNWLFTGTHQWTMTPTGISTQANDAFYVGSLGNLQDYHLANTSSIRSVLYLKINIKILGGKGTKENPFILKAS